MYDEKGLLLYEDTGGNGNIGLKAYYFDGRGSTVALADGAAKSATG